jgi:hypothetical protein
MDCERQLVIRSASAWHVMSSASSVMLTKVLIAADVFAKLSHRIELSN